MKRPRFNLTGLMTIVAVAALNLGIIRALYDGMWEELLFIALPTINVLAAVAVAGLRRRNPRAFALGFVTVGSLSLLAFHLWTDAHPWTFLRYAEPLCQAIDRHMSRLLPDVHTAAVYVVLAVAFVVPHTILGLVGGALTAKGWSMVGRCRKVEKIGQAARISSVLDLRFGEESVA